MGAQGLAMVGVGGGHLPNSTLLATPRCSHWLKSGGIPPMSGVQHCISLAGSEGEQQHTVLHFFSPTRCIWPARLGAPHPSTDTVFELVTFHLCQTIPGPLHRSPPLPLHWVSVEPSPGTKGSHRGFSIWPQPGREAQSSPASRRPCHLPKAPLPAKGR